VWQSRRRLARAGVAGLAASPVDDAGQLVAARRELHAAHLPTMPTACWGRRPPYGGSVDREIRHLVDELARRPEVLGVALFGSVARGDARPDSDVDVFVLVTDGMWREVEERGRRHVEFVFSSPQSTQAFGERRPDEYVKMWQEARVLLDKEGRMAELRQAAEDLRVRGKPRPDQRSIRHWQFDAEDQLRGVRGLRATDLPAAALVLHRIARRAWFASTRPRRL